MSKVKTKGSSKAAQRRAKQTEIPGTEAKQDPEMHRALLRLTKANVDLSSAHDEQSTASEVVVATMSKKKLSTYLDPKLKESEGGE